MNLHYSTLQEFESLGKTPYSSLLFLLKMLNQIVFEKLRE